MPEWILFLPIVFPLVATASFGLVEARVSSRVRPWLGALFLAAEIAAILVNIAPVNHRIVISDWPLASFSLAFEFDGIAILLFLTIFILRGAIWFVAPQSSRQILFDLYPTLVLTSSMVLILAGSLPTTYFAWVALDLSIFAWRLNRDIERDTALRSLVIGEIGGLLLFAGAAFLHTSNLDRSAAFFALAFWARLGLFPFQWIYPTRGNDTRDLWIARGVPLLAAGSLWVRWSALQTSAPQVLITVLAMLALFAAVAREWREEQPAKAVVAGAWHAVPLIPLAVAFGGDAGAAYSLWLTLGIAIGLAFFELALRWRAENRNRWPRIIWIMGLFSAGGVVLTPTFVGRAGTYVSLWEGGAWWLVLVEAVMAVLALAPLWTYALALEGAEDRDPTRTEFAGLALALVAFGAFSFAPTLIAQVMSPAVRASAETGLSRVIYTNNAFGLLLCYLLLFLPPFVSILMRDAVRHYSPHPRSLGARLARGFDLNWLARGVAAVGFEMGATARNISTLAEENPTIWILLVALWVAIFVLIPR